MCRYILNIETPKKGKKRQKIIVTDNVEKLEFNYAEKIDVNTQGKLLWRGYLTCLQKNYTKGA